ncbi:MAG: sigma-70 family RNA polymerase sigma factor [Acidobacteria bacterium]|nr:sigma-70 family RNA polymerase sigma factor [Acidobacteriota bacterium]
MRLFSRKPRLEEFEAAALPHLGDLYRTATRLVGDPARADDVVQEAYLVAWKNFDRFEPGTNCRAWLFRILFHCAHHYRRKWLNPREVPDAGEIIEQVPAASAAPSDRITDEEVLRALDAIPEDYRAAVLLVDVDEFSYKDAAGILEVPIGTVMSRLSRGRKLLRDRLAALAQSYGLTNREGMSA